MRRSNKIETIISKIESLQSDLDVIKIGLERLEPTKSGRVYKTDVTPIYNQAFEIENKAERLRMLVNDVHYDAHMRKTLFQTTA